MEYSRKKYVLIKYFNITLQNIFKYLFCAVMKSSWLVKRLYCTFLLDVLIGIKEVYMKQEKPVEGMGCTRKGSSR